MEDRLSELTRRDQWDVVYNMKASNAHKSFRDSINIIHRLNEFGQILVRLNDIWPRLKVADEILRLSVEIYEQ